MNQRAHTFEEESFFPSITDLMVGIIFIFIIIVMALILQIKDSQKSIPSSLITTLTNMSDEELAQTEYLIENKGDISRAEEDLYNEKIKNDKLSKETEILKKLEAIEKKLEKLEKLEILQKPKSQKLQAKRENQFIVKSSPKT